MRFVDDALARVQADVNEPRRSRGEGELDLIALGEQVPPEIWEDAEAKARERGLNAAAVVATLGVGLRDKGDEDLARPFLEAASECQDAMAAVTLGLIVEGTDRERARKLYRQSAEAGDSLAAYNLGRLYDEDRDYHEAQYWLQRSTDGMAAERLERMKAEGRI